MKEMKNSQQIIFEYCAERNISTHYIDKLLKRKDYDMIEKIFDFPKGIIELYDKEYRKWLKEGAKQ